MRDAIRTGWTRCMLVLLASVLLAACSGGTALYSALDERQANEMMGALLGAGIEANKRPSPSKTGWEISVPKSDIPNAMAVLQSQGLPREQFQTLGDIFRKEGFASSATDERGRYIHGLQQELAHTITLLPGVANARVHIALPERDPLGGATGKTSAAVFVLEQPGARVRDREADIKVVVKDGVEGLSDINQVSVKFATLPALPDAASQGAGTTMALSSVSPLAIGLAALVVVIIALLLAFSSRFKARRVAATADKPSPKLWQG